MELIYIRSMNTREIAKQLNIANSLVQAVKNRALSKLRHPSQSAGDRFENEEDWREKASCLGINNIDLFFPSRGEDTKSARGVCSGCRVAEDCLGYALRNSEKNGIWGGKSERERRGLRRAQAQSSRKPTAE